MLERVPGGRYQAKAERLPDSEIDATKVLEGHIVDESGNITETKPPGTELATFSKDLVPRGGAEIAPYVDIQPIIPEQVEAPRKFTVVGLDMNRDAKDFARDVADKRVTERLDASLEGGWLKRTAMSFVNNIRRDNMRQSEIRKATREIEDANDVLVGLVSSEDDRAKARGNLFKRWCNTEYGDEVIKTAAGEHRDIHEQDSPLAVGIKSAYEEYMKSNDPNAREILGAKVSRLFNEHLKADSSNEGAGNMRINNALETADDMKLAMEQGATMEKVMAGLEVISGEARTGARTEARYDVIDKTMEKLGKLGIVGNLLPEAAVAALAASAVSMGKFLGGSAAAQVLGVAIPGIVGGIIAGGREFRHLTLERRQNARELAMGGEIDPTDKRRQKIQEKGGYDDEETSDVIRFLDTQLQEITRAEGEDKPSDDALKAALEALAVAEFRNNFRSKDLLRSSGFVNGDGEVEDFGIVRGKLKIALRRELDADTRTRLGLLEPPSDIDELITKQSFESTQLTALEKNISDQDRAYLKFQLWESTKAAAEGVGFGLGGAIVGQEVFAALPFDTPITDIGTSQTGLVEQLWSDNTPDGTHQTLLADFFGPDYGGYHAAAGEYIASQVGADNKGTIHLSNDHHIEKNPDGSLRFVDNNGQTTIDNVKVEADGSLPPESQDALKAKGMDVRELQPTAGEVTHSSETRDVTVQQYTENQTAKGNTLHVDRNFMINGSEGVSNGAELGLDWTGVGVVASDGSFHMNVANMDKDAFDASGNHVSWAEKANEGTLKLAISPSETTQTTPIMVPINPDGTINIGPDSPAAPFFKVGPDGHAVFAGAYAEVMDVTGEVNPSTGATKVDVLATVVGTDEVAGGTIKDTVVTPKQEMYPNYKITTGGYQGPNMETDPPIWVPLVPIRPIKPIQERPPAPAPAPTPPAGPLRPELSAAPVSTRPELTAAPTPNRPLAITAAPAAAAATTERVVRRGGEAISNPTERLKRPTRATRPRTPRSTKSPGSRGTRREQSPVERVNGAIPMDGGRSETRPEQQRTTTDNGRPRLTRKQRIDLISGINGYAKALSDQVKNGTMEIPAMRAEVEKMFGRGNYKLVRSEDGSFDIKVNGRGVNHFHGALGV